MATNRLRSREREPFESEGRHFRSRPERGVRAGEVAGLFCDREIQHVVHCANKFSRNQSFSVAKQMLQVNYLLPARVLRIAIEVSALSFINLASAWQVTRGRLPDAPDYVSSKEAFRQHLDLNGDRIVARKLFVNQIFGSGDPREKLINQAFGSAINKEIIEVRSEMSELGLVFLSRLASEISSLISNDLARPGTYLYENYSRILVKDLMSDIGYRISECYSGWGNFGGILGWMLNSVAPLVSRNSGSATANPSWETSLHYCQAVTCQTGILPDNSRFRSAASA